MALGGLAGGLPTRGLALLSLFLIGLPSASEAAVVRFALSVGTVDVRLLETSSPASSAYFLNYVSTGRYDNTFVHQVPQVFNGQGLLVSAHVKVQGGGFVLNDDIYAATAIQRDSPVAPETGIPNNRGTLAFDHDELGMSNQWFFNVSDNPQLDEQDFSVFGKVLGNGMEVVDYVDNLLTVDASVAENAPGENFGELPVLDLQKVFDQVNVFSDDVVLIQSIAVLDVPDGDYNFDGKVDLADYTLWRDTLGSTTMAEADGNGNGIVDAADYQIWAATYGESSFSTIVSLSAVVPEPSAVVSALLALSSLVLLSSGCRFRRAPSTVERC